MSPTHGLPSTKAAATEQERAEQTAPGSSRDFSLHSATSGTVSNPTVPLDPTASRAIAARNQRFGRYILLERAGYGGMGIVYKAWDLELERHVALKMIKLGILFSDEIVKRFLQEARAAARLSHPNIVPVLDAGEIDGCHFITMEWAGGGSLQRRVTPGGMAPEAAAVLIEKVVQGVHYAHGKGVLHRDLKPGNVLLDEHGEPKIADFGLAKLLDEGEEITVDGQVLGTPAYMAPEQAAGKSNLVCAQSDVWSLGVILYELLAGTRPFVAESREELRQLILSSEAPSVRGVRSAVPRVLEAIVAHCLQREIAKRYRSAGALADDLARWRTGQPVSVRPERWLGRVRRRLRRFRLMGGALTLLLPLCLLAPLVYYTAPGRPLEKEEEETRNLAEEQLAAGQEATIIGETGAPQWLRWVEGADQSTWTLDRFGLFTVQSWKSALLELVQDPRQTRYRFSASIRHDKVSDEGGSVGLYVARGQNTPNAARLVWCLSLTYDDVKDVLELHRLNVQRLPELRNEPPPAGNEVNFHSVIFGRARAGLQFEDRSYWLSGLAFRPAEKRRAWRNLTIDVSPEGARASWDGREVGNISFAEATKRSRGSTRETGKIPAGDELAVDFHSRGSLGLIIDRGSAAIQRVRVTPLLARGKKR